MKFSMKDFFMENFIFLAVIYRTLHSTEWGRNITFMIKNDIIFIMHDVLAVLIYCKL